jgi:hypothetical protein
MGLFWIAGQPFPKSEHGYLGDLLLVPAMGFGAGAAAALLHRLTPGSVLLKDAMAGLATSETIMFAVNLREPGAIDQSGFILMGIVGTAMGPWIGKSSRS